MNFLSAEQVSETQTNTSQNHGFGAKNLALIVGVAAVLGILAWEQQPVRTAAVKNKESEKAIKLVAANNSAQVLGASTLNQGLIEQFANIQVTATTDNSQRAFTNYSQQVVTLANAYSLNELMVNQPGTALIEKQNSFVADLQKIAAPSQLADFHRLTIAYYSMYFLNTQGLLGQDAAAIIDLIQAQLQTMREGYRVSASVNLP